MGGADGLRHPGGVEALKELRLLNQIPWVCVLPHEEVRRAVVRWGGEVGRLAELVEGWELGTLVPDFRRCGGISLHRVRPEGGLAGRGVLLEVVARSGEGERRRMRAYLDQRLGQGWELDTTIW